MSPLPIKGKRYGLPYNCGPYGLDYNTAVVKAAPTSWKIFWDPQYKGKYTINNNFPKCNIWITALSLGYTYDQIFDIDKLDRTKIQQKLNILAQNAKSLWDGSANPDEFPQLALATDWGFAAAQANKKGGKWLIAAPKGRGNRMDRLLVRHQGGNRDEEEALRRMDQSPAFTESPGGGRQESRGLAGGQVMWETW